MLTPLVVAVIARGKLPLLPYLLALAMSANLGSVATLVGNPQNMIIGNLSRIAFADFTLALLPAAVAGMAIQYAVLRFGFRHVLDAARIEPSAQPPRPLDRRLAAIAGGALVLVFGGFVAGLDLAWTALAGGAFVMVLARRDTHDVLQRIDWHLLLFFAALFVVVDGLNGTGLPGQIHDLVRGAFGATATAQAWNLAWFSAIGSNLFSNVPFVLVAGRWLPGFADPALAWKVLALATTFAGNLTILGSVANIIVVESARGHCEVGFWDYAKYGIPVTLLTTIAGVAILVALG
jgi:Na+/H+ antiporter NhaD/arsenite permease-like protein